MEGSTEQIRGQRPIELIEDVIRILEQPTSPNTHANRDRVDQLVEEVSLETFRGVIVVMNEQGAIKHVNSQINILKDWNEENLGRSEVVRNILELVPEEDHSDIHELLRELHIPSNQNVSREIYFPVAIGKYKTLLPATVFLARQNILLMIKTEDLQQSLEIELVRLKALIQLNSNRGLWITDENDTIIDMVDKNLLHNLGYRKEEVLGKSIYTFIKDDYHDLARVRAAEHLDEKTHYLERPKKDGGLIRVKVVPGEIKVQGRIKYRLYLDHYNP